MSVVKNWVLLAVVACSSQVHADVRLQTDALVVVIDDAGQVASLLDKAKRVDYAAPRQRSPLLQVYRDGAFHSPQSATWNEQGEQLTLRYVDTTVVLTIAGKGTHITLEIIKATPLDRIERVQWGPIATSIRKHVGEVIGAIAKPDEIRFAAALPKTRSGKIMRRLLKEICAGGEVSGDTTTLEDFSVIASLQQED